MVRGEADGFRGRSGDSEMHFEVLEELAARLRQWRLQEKRHKGGQRRGEAMSSDTVLDLLGITLSSGALELRYRA